MTGESTAGGAHPAESVGALGRRYRPGKVPARVAGARTLGVDVQSSGEFFRMYERGLPTASITRVAEKLDLSVGRFLLILDLKKSTYDAYRRKKTIVNPSVNNALVDVAMALEAAQEYFGNDESARRWLLTPSETFGGRTPAEYAKLPGGQEYVSTVLARLAHGVYT